MSNGKLIGVHVELVAGLVFSCGLQLDACRLHFAARGRP